MELNESVVGVVDVGSILAAGRAVTDAVLRLASLLVGDATPGLVTVFLLCLLVVAMVWLSRTVQKRISALNWLARAVGETASGAAFSQAIDQLDRRVEAESERNGTRRRVADAWQEYRETLVPHDEHGAVILRNSARPALFFNSEDLSFGAGFFRIVPGLFVSVGLALTFLGLIAALAAMDLRPEKINASLVNLVHVASAKFIMSLTGLACSILFTIILRTRMGRLEEAFHRLCGAMEKRLTFISLEALAAEQLRALREQQENSRKLGFELVAELGRPLREELPAAISSSISSAMSPLLQQVGQMGAEGMGSMVKDLSLRFTDDVGRALSQASERLVQAGDRIAQLADRMDLSSGRVGSEMEGVIVRLSQAVDDLKMSMGVTAETASGAFTKGAEHLLSVMNQTLEGIRDNTGEGARAMSAAAEDLRTASAGFRAEIESAAKAGSESAKARMEQAGVDASGAIDAAGRSVLDAFGRTGAELGKTAEAIVAKASAELLAPLDRIGEQFGGMVGGLAETSAGLRRLADGIRAGADASEQAAGSMRTASQDLVSATVPIRATSERMEVATRMLSESTANVAETISRSAEVTARNAADTLATAKEMLGGEVRAVEASLAGLAAMVDRLRGQGDRLDDLDEKLGKAFETYAARVQAAVGVLFEHVKTMQNTLDPALSTLQSIVEQAEAFAPESRRRTN